LLSKIIRRTNIRIANEAEVVFKLFVESLGHVRRVLCIGLLASGIPNNIVADPFQGPAKVRLAGKLIPPSDRAK
jgi:hypothetical protein